MTRSFVDFGDGGRPSVADGRLDAPAFHRNYGPIWSVLAGYVSAGGGHVLEVGSGTGQHIVEFARRAPHVIWWPSDCDDTHLASVEAWRIHSHLPNIRAARRIDLSDPDWGLGQSEIDAEGGLKSIICINVLHISPWRACEGLLSGARRHLRPDRRLFVYGPFMRNRRHTAPSNAAFDARLRSQNADWGLRDTDELRQLAMASGFELVEIADMPANNLTLTFVRRP